jgi:hypothetical protein
MEDVAVYGYITPLKVKIVLALALSDSVVRDAEITMVRRFFVTSTLADTDVCIDIQSFAYGLLLCHI